MAVACAASLARPLPNGRARRPMLAYDYFKASVSTPSPPSDGVRGLPLPRTKTGFAISTENFVCVGAGARYCPSPQPSPLPKGRGRRLLAYDYFKASVSTPSPPSDGVRGLPRPRSKTGFAISTENFVCVGAGARNCLSPQPSPLPKGRGRRLLV